METTFSEANISPQDGAELIGILGITALDLQTPDKAAKYKLIAEYFKKFSDGPALARRITRNVAPDGRLDKIMQYTLLRKDLDAVRSQLNELPSQDTIMSEDPNIGARRNDLMQQEARIVNEIQYYE